MKLGALALGAAAAGASAYGAVAAEEAAAVMAGERPEDSQAIAQALTEHDDPTLGVVDRLLISVSARYGHDLRWDPADAGCIAGEILVGERRGPLRIDVEVVPCALSQEWAA